MPFPSRRQSSFQTLSFSALNLTVGIVIRIIIILNINIRMRRASQSVWPVRTGIDFPWNDFDLNLDPDHSDQLVPFGFPLRLVIKKTKRSKTRLSRRNLKLYASHRLSGTRTSTHPSTHPLSYTHTHLLPHTIIHTALAAFSCIFSSKLRLPSLRRRWLIGRDSLTHHHL